MSTSAPVWDWRRSLSRRWCGAAGRGGRGARKAGDRWAMSEAAAASSVAFGLSAGWVATLVFALSYVLIVSERLHPSIIALLGASAMIVVGVLSQDEAIRGIDFNTIALLTGMMALVSISRRCGMFDNLSVWSPKRGPAQPWAMLVMLSLTTAVVYALLDHGTTVPLDAPR